jgi:hypothetical protein
MARVPVFSHGTARLAQKDFFRSRGRVKSSPLGAFRRKTHCTSAELHPGANGMDNPGLDRSLAYALMSV